MENEHGTLITDDKQLLNNVKKSRQAAQGAFGAAMRIVGNGEYETPQEMRDMQHMAVRVVSHTIVSDTKMAELISHRRIDGENKPKKPTNFRLSPPTGGVTTTLVEV
jgi:hypothetical protein